MYVPYRQKSTLNAQVNRVEGNLDSISTYCSCSLLNACTYISIERKYVPNKESSFNVPLIGSALHIQNYSFLSAGHVLCMHLAGPEIALLFLRLFVGLSVTLHLSHVQ